MSELLSLVNEEVKTIADVVMRFQAEEEGKSEKEIYDVMAKRLQIMREAADKGINEDICSPTGLVGGGGKRLEERRLAGLSVSGTTSARASAIAMAVAEVNAAMGRVVAAPTAGSCGILPGVLFALEAEKNLEEEKLVKGLFTAAGIGMITARQANLSGAALGCQAECGVATAMAAAAAVEIIGGEAKQAAVASGIALQGLLGLVCDPVGGLVEIPCVNRNAICAAHALAAADIALAGICCYIPFDEIITAMVEVGRVMPPSLRETGIGGLAGCPSAKKLIKDKLENL
ncbi:MAG: L-serine dehydratase [Clostridia bacterium]|nr:L-serine dehydratase [Clostridia bacterium]